LFDSWFASSGEYEKLKKLKYLNCIECNSLKVEKSLMAPNLKNVKKENLDIEKYKKIKNKIKKYQKFINNNFEYVGQNFAYEARSIHYHNKKRIKKGIYGNPSIKEVKELKEEGINTETIPWFRNNKEN